MTTLDTLGDEDQPVTAFAAPDMTEVEEEHASERVQDRFAEIRDVLRVPFVDQLWRVLAGHPAAMAEAWRYVSPALGTLAAEHAADALRRESAIELALGLPAHKAFRGDMSRAEISAEDRERISNYTTAMHYVLPKLLLAAALLRQPAQTGREPVPSPPLPRGVPPGVPRVDPLPPDVPWGEIPAIFAEIRARHGYEPIADYYRSIARAGDFLRIAWNALRPIVGDPEFYARAGMVVSRAVDAANSLPVPAGAMLGGTLDVQEFGRTLDFYLSRLLPETLIEVTLVKGMLDGPHTATYNRLSLTDTAPVQPDMHA